MEAIDTVMSDRQIENMLSEIKKKYIYGIQRCVAYQFVAQAQAEITWDIAFKAGIREVVEYVDTLLRPYFDRFQEKSWQAKLKEWGIK